MHGCVCVCVCTCMHGCVCVCVLILPSLSQGLAGPGQKVGVGQVHSATAGPHPSLNATAATQVGGEATTHCGQSTVCTKGYRES